MFLIITLLTMIFGDLFSIEIYSKSNETFASPSYLKNMHHRNSENFNQHRPDTTGDLKDLVFEWQKHRLLIAKDAILLYQLRKQYLAKNPTEATIKTD